MPTCEHCLLDFPEREAIHDEIDGREAVFCCHGCQGIYRLINNEGLDDFYEKRASGKGWFPGPSKQLALDTVTFSENVHKVSDSELEVDLVIDGIRCASCVWLNEKILTRTPGVTGATVNYATHRARVKWDPSKAAIENILERIVSIGYYPKPFSPSEQELRRKEEQRSLLIRFGTAAFFSMQIMIFSAALYAGYFQGIGEEFKKLFHLITWVLATPVVFYSGWPFIRASVRGLRNLHFNMDVLVAAGAGAAYVYSVYQIFQGGEVFFDTAAMIITFILLGRYLEAGAKGRASEAIARLISLNPKEARLVTNYDNGEAEYVMAPVSSIRSGNIVEVLPGEKVPLDGVVKSGRSEVNESMLTGESKAVSKIVSDEVYAGTMNLHGAFTFEVTRTGDQTALAAIVRAVEDAQTRRAPVQALADRVVGWFVPAILLLSVATFLYWMMQGVAIHQSMMHAVAVLVIACPCALGLATPLAILVGTTHGASQGILIKGGDIIEKSRNINAAVLDKTGTITRGRPELASYAGVGMDDEAALRIAASIERHSEHSIGQAIFHAGQGLGLMEISDFNAVPGKGVQGISDESTIFMGSAEFLKEQGVKISLTPDIVDMTDEGEAAGSTVVYLSVGGAVSGIFVVSDGVRPEALKAVQELKGLGLSVSMVTGDNHATAEAVARKVGITDVKARISPTGKAEAVREMQEQGIPVLMAGDGINDAPALVEASLSVAMGRATDAALESADMVLIREDITLLPRAVRLARKAFLIIRQNIFWAFFYNAVAIPLAVTGVLHPIVAAIAMAMSSLTVVGNSMRARG